MSSIDLLRFYFHAHAIKILGLILIGLLLMLMAVPANGASPPTYLAAAPPMSVTGDDGECLFEAARIALSKVFISINPQTGKS
jgi:hypothetical protein